LKINLIGSGGSSEIAGHLASLLMRYGHEAWVNSISVEYFDVNVFCGLWYMGWHTLSGQDFYKKPCVALAVGKDVYKNLGSDHDMGFYLMRQNKVLIANEAMREKVLLYNKNVDFWHVPIENEMFQAEKVNPWFIEMADKRDVLLYNLGPDHQDLSRVFKHVKDHPEKRCTLIGKGYQDFVFEELPNLLSVRTVPYQSMVYVYSMHKEYRTYYTRDVDKIGKMACEALLMGLKVYADDEEILHVPSYMFHRTAIPRLISILREVVENV
jgi:hypothetical protein